MNNTRSEYQKRVSEIEIYFTAFQSLDKGSCSIVCTDLLGEMSTQIIDDDLSKILKANGFLLLYNLIEATIRNSITAICTSMQSSNATFRNLTDKVKKLWIAQEVKNNNNSDYLMIVIKKILEDELLTFKTECISIGGNIDAQEIRKIAKQFGCNEVQNGRDLVIIKEKRNKLAHGQFTFSEIGRDYTINELIGFKNNTKNYLDNVLSEIESYINYKGYFSV